MTYHHNPTDSQESDVLFDEEGLVKLAEEGELFKDNESALERLRKYRHNL